jgi:hypothetical protein
MLTQGQLTCLRHILPVLERVPAQVGREFLGDGYYGVICKILHRGR